MRYTGGVVACARMVGIAACAGILLRCWRIGARVWLVAGCY